MSTYFFDLVGRNRSEYDHRGSVFAGPEKAFRFAELMALDLSVDGAWTGWSVKVRNAQGQEFFSVPVHELEGAPA
jgi:hypothetical protein